MGIPYLGRCWIRVSSVLGVGFQVYFVVMSFNLSCVESSFSFLAFLKKGRSKLRNPAAAMTLASRFARKAEAVATTEMLPSPSQDKLDESEDDDDDVSSRVASPFSTLSPPPVSGNSENLRKLGLLWKRKAEALKQEVCP